MKGSGALMASVLAASTAALSSSSASVDDHYVASFSKTSNPVNEGNRSSICGGKMGGPSSCSTVEEKFAPRFDGLRFIETLVTAHR